MSTAGILVGSAVVSGVAGLALTTIAYDKGAGVSDAAVVTSVAPYWLAAVVLLVLAVVSIVGVLVLRGIADLIDQSRDPDWHSRAREVPRAG